MSAQGGYQDLLERSASVPYKKVLVVEGPTDIQMLNLMLDKPEFKRENPMSRWILGAAGGKAPSSIGCLFSLIGRRGDDDFSVLQFHAHLVAGNAERLQHFPGDLHATGPIEDGIFVVRFLLEASDVLQAA